MVDINEVKGSPLFTICLRLADGVPLKVHYDTIESCLADTGLRALFDCGGVECCEVFCGPVRITALPVQEWSRLKDNIVSNSTSILRKGY